MIDIHTHILPHFDDGAKDTEIAKEMLQAELAQGTKTLVFTSHYYGRKHSPARYVEQRNEIFERLKQHLPEGMEYRLGAEVHFTGINVPDYDELCKLAIDGTKYILVEFPFTSKWTWELLDKLADFIYDTGYTPIIAHVERYKEVMEKPSLATELVEMGCLLQVNAESFLDKGTKGLAFALLKHGYVHCIGSDTHDMEMRNPGVLQEAKAALEKEGFADEWARAQEIMSHVLADEKVAVPIGKPIKKFLGKYF